MVFPLLFLFLWPLMPFVSKLTPSGGTSTRAGHIVTEKLSPKANTICDILHFKHPTIILLFDHFSALTIIFTLLSTLFPNEYFSGSTVGRRDVFLTSRKNYLGPELATDNCPQTLNSCLLMHPVSSVTCSLSSTPNQCWLICSQVTSGRGHEAKNSL